MRVKCVTEHTRVRHRGSVLSSQSFNTVQFSFLDNLKILLSMILMSACQCCPISVTAGCDTGQVAVWRRNQRYVCTALIPASVSHRLKFPCIIIFFVCTACQIISMREMCMCSRERVAPNLFGASRELGLRGSLTWAPNSPIPMSHCCTTVRHSNTARVQKDLFASLGLQVL